MDQKTASALRLRDLEDGTEMTEAQIHDLILSYLPRNVRLRIMREDGIVQVQHIGNRLHLSLFADATSAENTYPTSQSIYEIGNVVLREAAWLLGQSTATQRIYLSSSDPITIAVPEKLNGADAIAALTAAVAALLAKANELLRGMGVGMRLVFPADADLD